MCTLHDSVSTKINRSSLSNYFQIVVKWDHQSFGVILNGLRYFFEFSLNFVCVKVTCKCLSNRTIKLFVQSLMAFMYSQDIYLPPTIFILQSNQSLVQILQDKFSDFVLHQQCRIPYSFFLDICKKFFMASYNPSNKN